MREIRSYGSVRGATRESRPYRDLVSTGTLSQNPHYQAFQWVPKTCDLTPRKRCDFAFVHEWLHVPRSRVGKVIPWVQWLETWSKALRRTSRGHVNQREVPEYGRDTPRDFFWSW